MSSSRAPGPLRPFLEAPTYARARLRLGISGVGTAVVLSLFALAVDLPKTLFDGKGGGLVTNASLFAVWLAGAALVSLPFEILGGNLVPKKFGRTDEDLGDWVLRWLRGVLMIVLLMSFSGALIVWAGRYGGRVGGVGMLGLIVLVMASFQTAIAQSVGGLRTRVGGLDEVTDELRKFGVVPARMQVVEAEDAGFTGGISGPPTAETLVIPLGWLGRFEPRAVAALLARRTVIVDRGLRALGLAAAIGFTLFGFGLASVMPRAGLDSVTGMLNTSVWFSLISFVGLLALPTPSRAATLAADAMTIEGRHEITPVLRETLEALDKMQDDEPSRSQRVESIFHPIPSLGGRLAALESASAEIAPWHVARTALFLSIAAQNPLHRLVHCNVGRPELWVFLPADG